MPVPQAMPMAVVVFPMAPSWWSLMASWCVSSDVMVRSSWQ